MSPESLGLILFLIVAILFISIGILAWCFISQIRKNNVQIKYFKNQPPINPETSSSHKQLPTPNR